MLFGRKFYFEKKFLTEVVLDPRQLSVIIENDFGDFFDKKVITNSEFGTQIDLTLSLSFPRLGNSRELLGTLQIFG